MKRLAGITQEEIFQLKSGMRDVPSGVIAPYLKVQSLKAGSEKRGY